MEFPKKIDDRLKDAIVDLQFASNVPLETMAGYFHSMNVQELQDNPAFSSINLIAQGLVIESNQTFFLTKDGCFRINVTGKNITFNLVNKYEGWDNYFPIIKKMTKPIFENNLIGQVQRIGVRYINQFDSIRIFDHIKATIRFDAAPVNSRGQFRIEFEQDGFLCIVTLVNSYPASPPNDNKYLSLFDVDIVKNISENQKITHEETIAIINDAHITEKKVFFSLLKNDFLRTLNPVY